MEAYRELLEPCTSFKTLFFAKRNLIGRLAFVLRVLILPFRATVIIENISFGSEALFFRRDLYVIHVPRGGGTFKIGWKDSGRLTLFTLLRLRRRDKVIVSSKLFADYLALQEATPRDRFVLCQEPINFCKSQGKRTKCLLALSECAENDDYSLLAKQLNSLNHRVITSKHPISNEQKNNYKLTEINTIVTDCTTLAVYGFLNGLAVFIVPEKQSRSRRLFRPQSEFFGGISSPPKFLNAFPKFDLTENSKQEFLKHVL